MGNGNRQWGSVEAIQVEGRNRQSYCAMTAAACRACYGRCLMSVDSTIIQQAPLYLNVKDINESFLWLLFIIHNVRTSDCMCKASYLSISKTAPCLSVRWPSAMGIHFLLFFWATSVISDVMACAPSCPNWRTSPRNTASSAGMKPLQRQDVTMEYFSSLASPHTDMTKHVICPRKCSPQLAVLMWATPVSYNKQQLSINFYWYSPKSHPKASQSALHNQRKTIPSIARRA